MLEISTSGSRRPPACSQPPDRTCVATCARGVDVDLYARRSVVAKRLKPVPVEAIARGYLIGSGWKDYQASGRLCGIALPAGLQQAERLPEPIFTPSTKAAVGDHDENISFDAMVAKVGGELAERVRAATLAIYRFAADFAATRHPHHDTEVRIRHRRRRPPVRDGRDADPGLVALWPMGTTRSASAHRATTSSSCATTGDARLGQTAPGPHVPAEIIAATAAKYRPCSAWPASASFEPRRGREEATSMCCLGCSRHSCDSARLPSPAQRKGRMRS